MGCARSWPPSARSTSTALWRCAASPPSGTAVAGEFRHAAELVQPPDRGCRLAPRSRGLPQIPPRSALRSARPAATSRRSRPAPSSAIAQFFFNPDAYFHFVDETRRLGADVPLGIMPFQLFARIAQFAARATHRDPALGGVEDGGLHGRRRVDPRLRARRRDAAVPALDRRRRTGIHFYTMDAETPSRWSCAAASGSDPRVPASFRTLPACSLSIERHVVRLGGQPRDRPSTPAVYGRGCSDASVRS